MNRTTHKILHESMHKSLDALVADFIWITGRFPSETSVMEFMEWSHEQTTDPALPADQKHEE